jgi:FixJ family two-component response regulator
MKKILKDAQEETKEALAFVREAMKVRILLCDDDKEQIVLFEKQLIGALSSLNMTHKLVMSTDVLEFKKNVIKNNLFCLIIDINMGKYCGVDVIQEMTALGFIKCPVIFISGEFPVAHKLKKIENMGHRFFTKPFSVSDWQGILGRLI